MFTTIRLFRTPALMRAAVLGVLATTAAGAQAAGARTDSSALDSLVRQALAISPALRAAQRRIDAAAARVGPAGLPSDPVLMAGLINQPLSREPATVSAHGVPTSSGGPDPMTMHMIGLSQTIPYPGKLPLRRQAVEHEVVAMRAALDMATRDVIRDVKAAYYDVAFADQALVIVERNRDVLTTLIGVTEARYGVGTAGQQDVLKARVEATRLADAAVTLNEQRRAAVARLNAALVRPSDAPLTFAVVPPRIARAAVPASNEEIRFASAALGARAADSPLPPVEELQQLAVEQSPEIREHEAMIAAQSARLQLARKNRLPDVDVSLQYGRRAGANPDMITALVSVPVPVFRGRKQDQLVTEADADLAALHAEHEAKVNALRAEVAQRVAEIERARAQLALYVKALLPQARGALTSATASYQVSRVDFLTVLDNQATVFTYETEYYRALSDFARNLAELERVVGKEIL